MSLGIAFDYQQKGDLNYYALILKRDHRLFPALIGSYLTTVEDLLAIHS